MAYDKKRFEKLSFPLKKEYMEYLIKEAEQEKRSKASQVSYIVEKYLYDKYGKGD